MFYLKPDVEKLMANLHTPQAMLSIIVKFVVTLDKYV